MSQQLYRAVVCDAAGNTYAETTMATIDSPTDELNGTGSLTVNVPIDDPAITAFQPLTREVAIYRDGLAAPFWRGPIMRPSASTQAPGTVGFQCQNPLWYLSHRFFGSPIFPTNYTVNGSLEVWSGGLPVDWTNSDAAHMTVTQQTKQANPGLVALGNSAALLTCGTANVDTFLHQIVTAYPANTEGLYFTLSAWFYIVPTLVSAGAYGGRGLFMQFVSGTTVEVIGTSFPIDTSTPTGMWLPATVSLQMPAPGTTAIPQWAVDCLPGGQDVALPGLRYSYRRWYNGDLVNLRFASGRHLTVTPNHPVLRADGEWVAACCLHKGDHCVSGRLIGQSSAQPDVKAPPAEVGEIHDALRMIGVADRVPGAPPNFHGDGRDGEVDVVAADGELWPKPDPATDEQVAQFGLSLAGRLRERARAGPGAPPRVDLLGRVPGGAGDRSRATSRVGGGGQTTTLLDRHPGHPQVHGLTAIADRHACCDESSPHGGGLDAETGGDRVDPFAVEVAADEIIDIEIVSHWSGWVYNFDTGHGWYLTGAGDNGIVTRNCRLYCPVGMIIWDAVQLTIPESLSPQEPGGSDQSLIAQNIVRMAQGQTAVGGVGFPTDATKSNLHIGTNCLAGETRVLTAEGVSPIRDLVDTRPRLLTRSRGAQWTEAPVQSFGVQPLLRVHLKRSGVKKTIRATPGHRWFTRECRDEGRSPLTERTTVELRPGHRLAYNFGYRTSGRTAVSPFGVAAGFVFGDGTRNTKECRVFLCGAKDEALLPFYPGLAERANDTCTEFGGLPKFFKDPPPLTETKAYLHGWLAGYFAADGTVGTTGVPTLESASRGDLELARMVATHLGIGTYGIGERRRVGYGTEASSLFRFSFIRDDLTPEFFVLAEHRRRFEGHPMSMVDRRGWTVEWVEDLGEEGEVFCAVVPETGNFTLEDNILTGNCPLTGVLRADLVYDYSDRRGVLDALNDFPTFLPEQDFAIIDTSPTTRQFTTFGRAVADGQTVVGTNAFGSASAAFTELDMYQPLTHQNIPGGALITAINSATQVTFSGPPALATGTGLKVFIGGRRGTWKPSTPLIMDASGGNLSSVDPRDIDGDQSANSVVSTGDTSGSGAYVGAALDGTELGTLTAARNLGSTYTTLAVTATSAPVQSGDLLRVGVVVWQPGVGEEGEVVIASAAAAAGATTIDIVSHKFGSTWPAGEAVTDFTPELTMEDVITAISPAPIGSLANFAFNEMVARRGATEILTVTTLNDFIANWCNGVPLVAGDVLPVTIQWGWLDIVATPYRITSWTLDPNTDSYQLQLNVLLTS